MAASVNFVMLQGQMVSPPSVQTFGQDTVVSFDLRTVYTWTNSEGKENQHEQIHHIVARNSAAELAQDLEEGAMIWLNGRAQTRSVDENGQKTYITEVATYRMQAFTSDDAPSINYIEAIGFVGQDPDVRNFEGGGQIANINIATSIRYRPKDSQEQKEITQWHRAVIRGKSVDFVQQYISKGSLIRVTGRLQDRTFTGKNGEQVITELLADDVQLLDRNNSNRESE